MEQIHYERQTKLESIASQMYKNSVLTSGEKHQLDERIFLAESNQSEDLKSLKGKISDDFELQ